MPERLYDRDLPPLEWIIDVSPRRQRWRGDMGRAEQIYAELEYLRRSQWRATRFGSVTEPRSPSPRPGKARPGDTLDDDPLVWTYLRRT
jgi:hypothetical protein